MKRAAGNTKKKEKKEQKDRSEVVKGKRSTDASREERE